MRGVVHARALGRLVAAALVVALVAGCRTRSIPRVTEGGGVRIDWDVRQENVRLAGGAVVAGIERYHRGDADDGLAMLETAGLRSRGPVVVTVLVGGKKRPLSGGYIEVVDGRASVVQRVSDVDADVVTSIDPALDAATVKLRLHAGLSGPDRPELVVDVARGPEDELVAGAATPTSMRFAGPREPLVEEGASFAVSGETPAVFLGSRKGTSIVSSDGERLRIRTAGETDAEVLIALRPSRRAALGSRLTGGTAPRPAIVALAPFVAGSHAFVPARVRLEAPDLPQTYPLVLDPTRNAEPRTWLVDVTAPGMSIQLPRGRYVLRATHGIGWSIARTELSLEDGDVVRAGFALTEEAPAPGTIGCDFHVHAEGSGDARDVTYADRVRSLVAVGVECAAATEHNHVGDHGPATKKLGLDPRYLPLPGVEVTTTTMGHFNVYPWPHGAAIPETDDATPRALFDAIHALPGSFVFQLNHPRMASGDHGSIGYLTLAGVDPKTGKSTGSGGKISYFSDYDALEIFNGYQLGELDDVVAMTEEWARMLDRGEVHVATGNSDSHNVSFPWAGFPRTLVDVGPGFVAAGRPVEAIVSALKRGRAIVTSGPIVALHVGEAGIGDEAHGAGKVRLDVHLTSWLAHPKARLLLGADDLGELALEPGKDALSFVGTRELPAPTRKRPLLALVFADSVGDAKIITGMTRALAVTNPVWMLP